MALPRIFRKRGTLKLIKSYRKHRLLTFAATGLILLGVVIVLVILLKRKPVEAASPPPLEVEVAEVEQKDVPVYSEWIGTTDGMVNAEIRSQVSGYLLRKDYADGTFVTKGQLLFEIDPRPFQAVLDQAKGKLAEAQGKLSQTDTQLTQAEAQVGERQAQVSQTQAQVSQMQAQLAQADAQLAQAEANQRKTQLDVNKYKPLREQRAVTQQELDNAVEANGAALAQNKAAKAQIQAANAQIGAAKAGVQTAQAQVRAAAAQVGTAKAVITSAKATVDAAQADVETAQINVSLTRIVAPIDGIAGIAQAQVGDLLSPTAAVLTTVSTVDPIKVYFTISEQEYLASTKHNSNQDGRGAALKKSELQLILSDGTIFPHPGKFFAADREVDERTGTIRIAGVFLNPGNVLRPGQYGKVRSETGFEQDALLVPQRSVSELQGTFQVAVVGADNKVEVRNVEVGDVVGSQQMIKSGLKPGEKVVVSGVQKVKTGVTVVPKPYVQPTEQAAK